MHFVLGYDNHRKSKKRSRNTSRNSPKTPSSRSPPKSSKKSKKSRGRTPNSAKRKLAFSSSASKKSKTSTPKSLTPRLDSLDEQIKKLESMMKSPKVSPKSLTPRFDNAEKQLDNLERIIKKDKRATDQERRFAELESDWKRQKSRAKTAKLARKFDALETAWNKQKATARKNTTKKSRRRKTRRNKCLYRQRGGVDYTDDSYGAPIIPPAPAESATPEEQKIFYLAIGKVLAHCTEGETVNDGLDLFLLLCQHAQADTFKKQRAAVIKYLTEVKQKSELRAQQLED